MIGVLFRYGNEGNVAILYIVGSLIGKWRPIKPNFSDAYPNFFSHPVTPELYAVLCERQILEPRNNV